MAPKIRLAPKKHPSSHRYSMLFDNDVYAAGKLRAHTLGMKLYLYLNTLVAKDAKVPVPTYLKHVTETNEQ